MKIIETLDDNGNYLGCKWRCVNCNTVVMAYMGNDVDCERCGQLYNGFGQRLNPPNQWGEGHDY